MDRVAGLADQSVPFSAWTVATGVAVTVTSATAGLSLWYRRGVTGAKVAITPIGDLATLETAHTDKAILVVQGAEHRLDLPDAAFVAGVLTVAWGGTATGIEIVGGECNLIMQANTATDASHWLGTAPLALSSQQVQAVVPTTQKVDVETIKTKGVTVDAGGTTFPSGTVAKAGDKMDLLDTILEDA